MWDPSISLGNVLTFVGLMFAFFTFHIGNVKRFEDLKTKVDILIDWYKKQIHSTHKSSHSDD